MLCALCGDTIQSTGKVRIEGGNFTTVQGDAHFYGHANGPWMENSRSDTASTSRQNALQLLQQNVAPGAFHDSDERYDPPKCHPHTRQAVMKKIIDWLNDPANVQLFLWLYGPAGAGKSAISQTIAEICHEAGNLGASFFFSRTALLRNDKARLIATLSYQLTLYLPSIAEHVTIAINNDPSIFSRNLATQIKTLIINPLNDAVAQAGDTWCPRPILLLFDGLDECGDPKSQQYILKILSDCAQRLALPIHYLIASRPEQEIREAFNDEYLFSHTLSIALDNTYHPDADIQTFLRSKFSQIKAKHPSRRSIPPEWPGACNLRQLVDRSSGQFIYAATVVKYIESRRHQPMERLGVILGLSAPGDDTPFVELDAIYHHILSSAVNIPQVLEILHYMMKYDSSAKNIKAVLGHTWEDVQILLADLHAIINIPEMEDSEDGTLEPELSLHHASLEDFLRDPSRCRDFYISPGDVNARFARLWIKYLSNPHPSHIHAFQNFLEHCTKAHLTQELFNELYDFDVSRARGSHWCGVYQILEWLKKQNSPAAENMHKHQLNNFSCWIRHHLHCYPSSTPNYLAMALALPETVKSSGFSDLLAFLTNDMDTEKSLQKQVILMEFLFNTSEPPNMNDLNVFSRTVFTLLTGYNGTIQDESLRLQEHYYASVSYTIAAYIVSSVNQHYVPGLIRVLSDLIPKAAINLELAIILSEGFPRVRLNPEILSAASIEASTDIRELAEANLIYIQKCGLTASDHLYDPEHHLCAVCKWSIIASTF